MLGFWKVLMYFLLKPVTSCASSEACEGKLLINWARDAWDVTCSSCINLMWCDAHCDQHGHSDNCLI